MIIDNQSEHKICWVYPCYIEYGDIGDMSNHETKLVDEWVSQFPVGACFEYSDTQNFATCEISNLLADCVTVTVTTFKNEG